MRVHLIDGTYELFRHYYALPSQVNPQGIEVAATRGVIHSLLGLIDAEATHLAVATDHVVESFRNDLWPGYKTGDGMDPLLLAQFEILEDALRAVGIAVWPMVEMEADDGLASGVSVATADPRVEQVLVCTPDKDLAQVVVGQRVVMVDRRRRATLDEPGVVAKFGVPPQSIPDWLALVGDAADGFPGIPGFGKKTAATLLTRYARLEDIPRNGRDWDVPVRAAERLAQTLEETRQAALLFRRLATLRTDAPIGIHGVDELLWRGPTPSLDALAAALDDPSLVGKATQVARRRVS